VETRTDRTTNAMGSLADALGSSMRASRQLLTALFGPTAEALSEQFTVVRESAGRMSGCSCDIPDPCWMPKRYPTVLSHACPGATARLRLQITNCGLEQRRISVAAQGAQSAVVVEPESLSLAPFETGEVVATVTVPHDKAEPVDVRLWVRGCRDHVVPWRVSVSGSGCDSLHEVGIEDCPDLVHHWYDHSYCQGPCYGGRVNLHD
jgi:hypothetical protein